MGQCFHLIDKQIEAWKSYNSLAETLSVQGSLHFTDCYTSDLTEKERNQSLPSVNYVPSVSLHAFFLLLY